MDAAPLDGMIERDTLGEELVQAVISGTAGEVGLTTSVHGAGGFGKTTLARWLCDRPEVKERFAGGLLWVTVGAETSESLLAQRINDLSYKLSGERPGLADPETAGAELGRRLDAVVGPVLLVIDDVWDEVRLRHFRHGGLRCTRLVTTRMPDLLGGNARRIKV